MEFDRNILVTGATGFIGRHLCRSLVKEGYHLYTLCRRPQDIGGIDESNSLRTVRGDVCDGDTLCRDFSALRIRAIVHLAAFIPPRGSGPETNSACFETNVRGTFNLLELCRKSGIPEFVYASTQGVYGRPLRIPVRESHRKNPADFYSMTKFQGEQLCAHFSRYSGLKVIVLRYAGVFGPGKEEGAVYNFLQSAFEGKPPAISGDGSQSRDFVYVKDVVAATVLALEKVSQVSFDAYNIGSGREIRVSELARTVYNTVGVPVEISDSAISSPDRFYLDISKARRELGYQPRPVEEALKELARAIKQHREG